MFNIKDDVSTLMPLADTNGDGQIDYQEFSQMLRKQHSSTRKDLKNGLSRFNAMAASRTNSDAARG